MPTPFDSRWPTVGGGPRRTRIAPKSFIVGSVNCNGERNSTASLRACVQGNDQFGGRGRGGSFPPTNDERMNANSPTTRSCWATRSSTATELRIVSIPLNLSDKSEGSALLDLERVKLWEQRLPQHDGQSARSNSGMPRFTVTAAGDRIFARLGPPGSRGVEPALQQQPDRRPQDDRGQAALAQDPGRDLVVDPTDRPGHLPSSL